MSHDTARSQVATNTSQATDATITSLPSNKGMDKFVDRIQKNLSLLQSQKQKVQEENLMLRDTIKQLRQQKSRIKRLPKKTATDNQTA